MGQIRLIVGDVTWDRMTFHFERRDTRCPTLLRPVCISLRTLILVMLLGGPMLAAGWWGWGYLKMFRALDHFVLTGDPSQLEQLAPPFRFDP